MTGGPNVQGLPLVVVVNADTAVDNGIMRYPIRRPRARPDPTVEHVDETP